MIEEGGIPRPIKFGRSSFWLAGDIRAIARKLAQGKT